MEERLTHGRDIYNTPNYQNDSTYEAAAVSRRVAH